MVGLLGAFALNATMDDMDNKWRELCAGKSVEENRKGVANSHRGST